MENGLILLAVLFGLKYSCGCDPDFCVGRTHGARFADPAKPSFYYSCDLGRAQYLSCPTGLVFKNSILACVFPDPDATTPTPVTETPTGTLVNGYCEAVTVDTTTAGTTTVASTTPMKTTTATSATTATYTEHQGKPSWNLYRKHPNKMSACTVCKTVRVSSPMVCGTLCLQLIDCTDFNFFIPTNECDAYACDLLTCPGDYFLSSSPQYHFYQRI